MIAHATVPNPDDVLAGVLRGEAASWPYARDAEASSFLEAAGRHRVTAIVAWQLRRGALAGTPKRVEQALAQKVVRQAIVEERLAAEARRVVDALWDAGVPFLLMKGAALAYTCYPHPCLRPRADTDLMIRARDTRSAAAVFERLGYRAANMTRGDLLLHQRSYEMTDGLGVRHLFDVHEKIAAPHAVANVLGWDELDAQSMAVPALGDRVRAIGPAHALVLACIHRVAHHYDDPCLLWLYDIHLLWGQPPFSAKNPGDSHLPVDMVAVPYSAAAAMCARSLALARERLGTPVPHAVLDALAARADDSAVAFGRGRKLDVLLSDLKALAGWRQRLQLIREHLLPPPDYIRTLYGISNPLLLPALYAHRALTGARRWMQPE